MMANFSAPPMPINIDGNEYGPICAPTMKRITFVMTTMTQMPFACFTLLTNAGSLNKFLEGPWYNEYLNEVSQIVLETPTLITTTPQWIK